MSAAKINLAIEQRSTFRRSFIFKNKFKKPYDLSGYDARMQVRTPEGALLLDLSVENGRIVFEPLAGIVHLYVSDEDTAKLEFNKAVYDFNLLAPNGDTIRMVQGTVTLSPGYTY